MSKKIFIVTLPNGQIFYRTSASKNYTHAVVDLDNSRVYSWAGSAKLAHQASRGKYAPNGASVLSVVQVEKLPAKAQSTGGNSKHRPSLRAVAALESSGCGPWGRSVACSPLEICDNHKGKFILGSTDHRNAVRAADEWLNGKSSKPATRTFSVSMTRIQDVGTMEIEASTKEEAERMAREIVKGAGEAAWTTAEYVVMIDGEVASDEVVS